MENTFYKQVITTNKLFIFLSVLDLKTELNSLNICYNQKYYIISLSTKIRIFPSFFSLYLFSKNTSILNTFIKNINDQFFFVQSKYQLRIKFIGTGYKFYISNKFLYLILGYSHIIKVKLPNSCGIDVDNNGKILLLFYPNKYILGNILYIIKSCKKFNIYKGKGIKNSFDHLKLKLGKTKNIKK